MCNHELLAQDACYNQVLGYALPCCYCPVHVIVVSGCTVDTVAYMYMVVNSMSRVHGIWVHMQ